MENRIWRYSAILMLAIILGLSAGVASAAEKAAYVWSGQYIETKIPAPSIQNSYLPVPAETTLCLYLPPTYQSSGKSYPVIYFLHGADEEAKTWSKQVSKLLDTLYAKGFGKEFIIAFPTGKNNLGSTFYTNSPVAGNWEDHITKDALEYVEKNYRTLSTPGGRAIVGFSMGGYGALAIGMGHPELYSCVYAMSPGVLAGNALSDFQLFSSKEPINAFLKGLERANSLNDGTKELAKTAKWRSGLDSFTLAYGLAFAPNPDKGAPYMDYPYSIKDGQLVRDDAVWRKWYTGFGAWESKVDTYRNNLLGLRLFAFDAGKQDFYSWIPQGCKYLDTLLASKGIPHIYGTYNGNHGDKLLQRMEEAVFPELAKAMDTAR